MKGLSSNSKRTNLKTRNGTSLPRTIAAPSLTTSPAYRISPQHAEARGENGYQQRDEHADPEFHLRLLVSAQRPGQVIFRRRNVIAEFIHSEDPVARVRRHQEICEGPARGHRRGQESGAAGERFLCVASLGESKENKIKDDRTREKKHRKAERYHVRDRRKHWAQFRLGGEQRENPIPGKPPDRVHRGHYCPGPTASGGAAHSNQHDRPDHAEHTIVDCAVHQSLIADVFVAEHEQQAQQQRALVEQQPTEPFSVFPCREVQPAGREDEPTQAHNEDSQNQHDVWRAQDGHIQSEGVVPPAVERSRGQHAKATPGSDESPERSTESPNLYGVLSDRGGRSQRGVQNQVGAAQSSEDGSELDREVRGRSEGVAPNADVPGNIPVEADSGRGYGYGRRPRIPRRGLRANRRASRNRRSRRKCDPCAVCHKTPLPETRVLLEETTPIILGRQGFSIERIDHATNRRFAAPGRGAAVVELR